MRNVSYSLALSAALIVGATCGAWAQDQPAAGSPPPATEQQAPAQTQQNAAPAPNDQLPPPPIDGRRAPNPHREAKMLARKLGLTSVQQAQIEPILADRQERMRNARADASLTPQDRRMRFREIQRDSTRRINGLLTEQQRQEYRQMRQEQRARRQEHGQQQPEPLPPAGNEQ